jgi:2-polyprenyl-6-methoxyphenol hydroxylase-like FAD-dependent oxidoreductase
MPPTSHTEPAQHLLVCGGGIGGLTAALALAQKGVAVDLFEQATEFKEVGAGLQVGPNAFRIFDRLGLTDAISALATFPESFTLMDAIAAEPIVRMPLGADFLKRFTYPYGLMHRADLHWVLLNACKERAEINLHTNSKITSFSEVGDEVIAALANGDKVTGKGLVGADGLWSLIRQTLVNDGEPKLAGHVCYRAVAPIEQIPPSMRQNAMNLWVGPKMHMVTWPMRKQTYANITVVFHSGRFEEGWDTYGDPDELKASVAGLHPSISEFVMSIDDWRMYVLRDREPIKEWSKGRITLLGDAAHPMLQYLAQGACMAMEDAVCLADNVASHGDDIAAAYQSYQQQRYIRTARVQLTARLYGHVYHAQGATADLRNHFLQSRTPAQIFESMAWIYE